MLLSLCSLVVGGHALMAPQQGEARVSLRQYAGGGKNRGEMPSAMRSVVKIYVTLLEPDYGRPWSYFMEEEVVGSGFLVGVDDRIRIVTNAHVVMHGADVRVRRHGETRKYSARVLGLSHESDLALLAVTDPDFFKLKEKEKIEPLQWSLDLPELLDDIAVCGYPLGGDAISVTRGVVSRIDAMPYFRGASPLLVIQVDAAVNSGNSGGPALDSQGRVSGVAFSGYAGNADNIGYLVPAAVAQNFLSQCAAAAASSSSSSRQADTSQQEPILVRLCTLGVTSQRCENVGLRSALGLDDAGVLVTRVATGSCLAGKLFPGDVLLSIDNQSIACDASVAIRGGPERVHFAHAVTSRRPGEQVLVQFSRAGAILSLNATLAPLDLLVPLTENSFQAKPSFLVLAGLVLQPLSLPLMEALASSSDGHHHDSDHEQLEVLEALHADVLSGREATEQRSQVVVWTSTLPAGDSNAGYDTDLRRNLPVLNRLNGIPVKSLLHAAQILEQVQSDTNNHFFLLEFAPPNARPGDVFHVVLNIEDTFKANDIIIKRNGIPALVSDDLIDQLTSKKATESTRRGKQSPRSISPPQSVPILLKGPSPQDNTNQQMTSSSVDQSLAAVAGAPSLTREDPSFSRRSTNDRGRGRREKRQYYSSRGKAAKRASNNDDNASGKSKR